LPAPSPPADPGRDRLLVPVAGLCLLVGTAAYLMVFTMLGQIGASLTVSGPMLGWIVIATIITATVSAALFPALGSVIGQRHLMVVTMGCLAVGSVLSATAPDGAILLAGRIVAAPGFAAGSLSIAIVGEHRSGPSLPRSFGIIAAFAGAAAGVGFTLGGAVEQAARGDWRSVFVAVAAVSAITGILAAVTIPGRTPASRRADVAGALLLAGGLVAALLPITEGAAWGWVSWRVIGLFAGAVVLLTAWAVAELRLADPLVRLGVLMLPGVIAGTVLFFVTSATVAVINLTVPPFLEAPAAAGYGAAASVLDAGLDLLPFALAITAAGFVAGRLARRVSARLIAVVTLGCEALALGLLAGFHHTAAQVVILLAVFGVGHGGTLAAEYVILTRPVPPAAAGAAVGLASAVAGVGGAVASAVTTALLASRLAHAGTATLPVAAGYDRAWLCGAGVGAAGAVATAIAAYAARARTHHGRPSTGTPQRIVRRLSRKAGSTG
jgi:MFS family permease